MSTTVTYKGETLTTVSNDTATLETSGTWLEDDITLTDVTSGGTMQAKTNISPTTSSQTITPDVGYDGLSSVQINAMPTGTAGTPTATKGAVSNHSISVTPSVTNTTGYIIGSTINGTAVTVSASELDSGSKSITANGNSQDVVGYASVDVAVPNSYSAGDEGKVVSSGALVSQTAHADVTPTTSDQTIDTTTNNSLKVKGDANLVAGNIKKDVEIFGTTGSYEGGGGGYDLLDIVTRAAPTGAVVLDSTSNFNVRTYFFQNYTGITSFSSNKASQLHGYAFQNCSNMTSVNCPNCSKLEASVFEGCSKLASITLSNNYSVTSNCFKNCTLLQDFECWANGTASTMFYGDTSLRFVDFKNLNLYRFETNCFQNCSALKTLVLRKTSSVVGLANVNAFSGTPFASGGSGGTIYVPSALINTYKTSSNWSTVHGYGTITWTAIEGSIYA